MEIKFRAWHEKKIMKYSDGSLSTFFYDVEHNAIELMQFTGLHDKNGKEIYEGDFVKDNIGIREVKIGWFKFRDCDSIEHEHYGVYGVWDDGTISAFDKCDLDKLELIGNKFDNPEMIK